MNKLIQIGQEVYSGVVSHVMEVFLANRNEQNYEQLEFGLELTQDENLGEH